MVRLNYDFAAIVRTSEKVSWTVDRVMPAAATFDVKRPFLPDTLAPTARISCLNEHERLKLNQIAGNSYLNLFLFVEEYIISMAVDHAQAEMFGDRDALRALMRFADEELKHQELFQRCAANFHRDFGHECGVIGSAAEVAGVILGKHQIAVLLITLHLEIMTQAHYTECVKNDRQVDPLFASVLKHHWVEEAQHVKIDSLELNKLLLVSSEDRIKTALNDYLSIVDAFDGLLGKQAQLDFASLANVTGRGFTEDEEAEIVDSQYRALQETFLCRGMKHKTFVGMLEQISKPGMQQVAHRAGSFG